MKESIGRYRRRISNISQNYQRMVQLRAERESESERSCTTINVAYQNFRRYVTHGREVKIFLKWIDFLFDRIDVTVTIFVIMTNIFVE